MNQNQTSDKYFEMVLFSLLSSFELVKTTQNCLTKRKHHSKQLLNQTITI